MLLAIHIGGNYSMTISPFEKFAVRKPIYDEHYRPTKGRHTPPMTYLSSTQIPEANYFIELSWIHDIPQPDLPMGEKILDHDQILLFIGSNPDMPQELGATIEFFLGGQPIVFNTTTSVFIPKNTSFGPLTWREFLRPHMELSIILDSGVRGKGELGSAAPKKTMNFDYEQYVIRSPMREAGPNFVEGRQNPTMTYMSRTQINIVNDYIEFGWIWDVPNPPIPKMRHDGFDEIVLHIGSDSQNPQSLGGTLKFGIGDDLIEFDTTHCAYLPKGLDHGPLIWKEVHRPLIELAMMGGAGTLDEGWKNSFFDLPDGSRRGPK
jgi:hypothetical protein